MNDERRYEVFYEHYRPFVASFVTRRVDQNVVEDLVAEVFAVAWRRREQVPEDALPWLYRTARNVIGTRYRSQARSANLSAKVRQIPIEPCEDPAEAAAQRDAAVHALSALDDDDRELLLLIAWDGLTTAEVAVVIDVSVGAAAVRIHRARRRLAQRLDPPQAAMRRDDHE